MVERFTLWSRMWFSIVGRLNRDRKRSKAKSRDRDEMEMEMELLRQANVDATGDLELACR